jgi:hypothetical protein
MHLINRLIHSFDKAQQIEPYLSTKKRSFIESQRHFKDSRTYHRKPWSKSFQQNTLTHLKNGPKRYQHFLKHLT